MVIKAFLQDLYIQIMDSFWVIPYEIHQMKYIIADVSRKNYFSFLRRIKIMQKTNQISG